MKLVKNYFILLGIIGWLSGCLGSTPPSNSEIEGGDSSLMNNQTPSEAGGHGEGMTGDTEESGEDDDTSSPGATITGNPRPNGGSKPMGLVFQALSFSRMDQEATPSDTKVISAPTVVLDITAETASEETEILVPEDPFIVDLVSGELLTEASLPDPFWSAEPETDESIDVTPTVARDLPSPSTGLDQPKQRGDLPTVAGLSVREPLPEADQDGSYGRLTVTFGPVPENDPLWQTDWGRSLNNNSQVIRIYDPIKGLPILFRVSKWGSLTATYPAALEGAENLLMSFDTDLWLDGIDLNNPGFKHRLKGIEGDLIYIDSQEFPEVILQFISNLSASVQIFADINGNRRLDPEEFIQ